MAAFNEARVVGDVVAEVVAEYPQVVVVDDGSSDATGAIAQRAGAAVVRHPINLGQGAALQTGIAYALRQQATCIVTFDADGQHRARDIAALLSALRQSGADFALGSRFLGSAPGMPRLRRVTLRLATLFTYATTGLELTDTHNGLRAMTAQVAQRLDLRQSRMAHASELIRLIARHRWSFVEVPVHVRYTAYSMAKGQKLSDLLAIVGDLMAGRFER
jgi:glycosyltransferase involved in cell wall biosynthesis